MATQLTKENFELEVLQSKTPVLVDFYADWCGPCRALAPVLDEIANERPELKLCKVDVDAEPELAGQYQVMSIPMLVVFNNGEAVKSAVGARPKQQLLELIEV